MQGVVGGGGASRVPQGEQGASVHLVGAWLGRISSHRMLTLPTPAGLPHRRSRQPSTGSPGASNTQPPRLARSGSSIAREKLRRGWGGASGQAGGVEHG